MAVPQDLVDKLRDLGISERSARFALTKTNNNVEQAAEYVFSGRADKDEVSETPLGLANVPTLQVVDESEVDRIDSSPSASASGSGSGSASGSSDLPATPPASPRWSLVPLVRLASGGRRKDDTSSSPVKGGAGEGYHDGQVMERTASDPQRSSRTLTQRSSYLNVDSTWFEKQSANLIMNALSRTGTPSVSRPSTPQPSEDKWSKKSSHHHKDHKDHKEKNDLTAKPTAGALAALGFRAAAVAGPTISPASPVEDRKIHVPKPSKANKTFLLPSRPVGGLSSPAEDVRPSRSPSPFFRARRSREERRAREKSPEITALRKDSIPGAESAAESDGEGIIRGRGAGGSGPFRPQASAYESPDDSGDDSGPGPMTEDEHDDDHSDLDTHDDDDDDHHLDDHHDGDDEFDDDDDDFFDEQTKENTEANAIYDAPSCKPDGDLVKPASGDGDGLADTFDVYGEEVEQDVLGEGPNVVVPPEPMFQAPTVTGVKRRTSKKGLELVTSRPAYARDRCTINITQGDPDGTLDKSGKRMRRYVVLSDLSEESRYAVEWAVGTVARDGDELFLISVVEDEGKVDPKSWSSKDQQTKLKVQKERQTIASLLVRQVTSLLSRTRLNVTVTCQALHAKNARYMLLDLIDFLEPTLVIVGSRGLGQLKGILLGSTSHYLVQKSSVPVMVARRRMYRPLRSTDPEQLRHSPRVSLASANIEKAASKKQEDDIVDAADADNVDVQVHEVREEAEDQGIKQH